jgi:WD40 repeat protein
MYIDADGKTRIWHITSGQCVKTIENIFDKKDIEDQCLAIDYTADGSVFAVAGTDCAIHLYDQATGQQLDVLSGGR